MSIKFLSDLKRMGLGVVFITSALFVLLAEQGRAVPLNRLPNASDANELLPEANSLDNALPAGAGVAVTMPTANFVPQSVLDAANQLSVSSAPSWPGLGQADKFLPAQDAFAPLRLMIKLSERRVYIYQREQVKTSFPIAIGRSGWETPTGKYTVIQMQQDPIWQHPFTGELVPPGRDNPLGARWIGFWTDGTNYIGFHGTPNEESVGQPASHGCVRMYNQDVIKLFEMVRMGTTVEVIP